MFVLKIKIKKNKIIKKKKTRNTVTRKFCSKKKKKIIFERKIIDTLDNDTHTRHAHGRVEEEEGREKKDSEHYRKHIKAKIVFFCVWNSEI